MTDSKTVRLPDGRTLTWWAAIDDRGTMWTLDDGTPITGADAATLLLDTVPGEPQHPWGTTILRGHHD